MSSLADTYAYIAVFGFFYLFLKYLIRLAEKNINKPSPTQKNDDFMKANGYSYDFVLVYQVHPESSGKLSQFHIDYSLRNVIERLTNAKLECDYFYSCQRDEIYIKIRAAPELLKAEAARTDYRLMLDSSR